MRALGWCYSKTGNIRHMMTSLFIRNNVNVFPEYMSCLSYCILLYFIISYRIISYHILSPLTTSYWIASYLTISCHMLSDRNLSYPNLIGISYRIVSYCMLSYRIGSNCISSIIPVSHLDTKLWENRIQVKTY